MSGIIITSTGQQVQLRRSVRARRLVLRVPRDGAAPVLTMPHNLPLAQGHAFLEERADWLRQAVSRVPPLRIVTAGSVLPVEGRPLTLTPAPCRVAGIEGDRLLIPAARPAGPVVQAFLRSVAHRRLLIACDRYADLLGRPYRILALRDTRSRWGSCSHDGRLMFSWRLAMAPPEVLAYVAAHEVAHLLHMDHSARFWAAVAQLMPDYPTRRGWLRQNGSDLQAWRFTQTVGP